MAPQPAPHPVPSLDAHDAGSAKWVLVTLKTTKTQLTAASGCIRVLLQSTAGVHVCAGQDERQVDGASARHDAPRGGGCRHPAEGLWVPGQPAWGGSPSGRTAGVSCRADSCLAGTQHCCTLSGGYGVPARPRCGGSAPSGWQCQLKIWLVGAPVQQAALSLCTCVGAVSGLLQEAAGQLASLQGCNVSPF